MPNPGEAVRSLFEQVQREYVDPSLRVNESWLIRNIVKHGNQILSENPRQLEKTSHPSGRYDIGVVNLESLFLRIYHGLLIQRYALQHVSSRIV